MRSVIDRVYHLVPAGVKIKMKIVIYRDYASGPQLVESSPLSEDPELLCGYLSHVETSGGEGNGAEAVEAGLEEALRDPASRPHLIFVAGDEQAHEAEDFLYQWKDNRYPQGDRTITPGPDDIVRVESDPYCRRTAEQIAQQCAELSIPIHTLVVGHDKKCIRSFKQIAKLSGGTSGMLDGSDAMRDMMCMAILANLASASVGAEELIQRYLTKYGGSDGRALSPEAKVFGRNLLAGRK
ncbi:hypothetical protein EXS71_04345 [Candidatus Uhrbacteria bacterium]|nr:hypothetical protein [Candidatus Uhrbacteria bacterium]